MAITFRLRAHTIHEAAQLVEVWSDDKLVAAIYPAREPDRIGIRVISRHLRNDPGGIYIDAHDPPSLEIRFDPLVD
jgi:hypothetical protein